MGAAREETTEVPECRLSIIPLGEREVKPLPNREDFVKRRPAFTCLLSGYFGAGKTLQALSFPKCYVISVDPNGLEPLRQPKNQKFLDNLAWYEEIGREDKTELKDIFDHSAKADKRTSIYGCIEHAKQLAAKGEVETLVLDGGTYLVDLCWAKINEFEKKMSVQKGTLDSQSMYRELGIGLHQLFAANLLTGCNRSNMNLICTFHLKRESDEQMQGNPKKARKLMLNSDIALMIEGGFRNKIEGLFGGSLYLEKVFDKEKNVINYSALCDVGVAFKTTVLAKNRWGLKPRIDLNNKSLYEHLMETLAAPKLAAATK